MAKSSLVMPVTSCASEGVFNKAKNIVSPQRALLSSLSVEILLLPKDWYCTFGALYVAENDLLVVSSNFIHIYTLEHPRRLSKCTI